MKNSIIYISFITLSIIFSSCNDFLDRSPLDEVGSVDYFKSTDDLETYMNQFYTDESFPVSDAYGRDFDSDNAVAADVNTWLDGANTLDGASAIDFTRVRAVNYFFDNYNAVEENASLEDYQQYLGEAYFFRGLIYFELLQKYGDIQWFSTEIGTEDEELYNARDPRNTVADNIIADLDLAATYLQDNKTDGASRINKWMALLLQSRVALFEGSWEKYHDGTVFGVDDPDPDKYFEKAVEATEEIINSGIYDIYSTGDPTSDFANLFTQLEYSTNDEVMFWKEYNNDLGKGDVVFRRQVNYEQQYPYEHSVTKELADSYLCNDGLPISVSSLFQGHTTLMEEKENRDPRFYQTIATPDAVWLVSEDGTIQYWNDLIYKKMNTSVQYYSPCGYVLRKGYNPDESTHLEQYEETPGIIYRYAEVLLNYAEAKAELGTITQSDIDMSIKALRDRVGMPNLNISGITVDPDWDFPDLSPLINEIRRERRVELASEGLRAMDIIRWAAADELIVSKRPTGFLAAQIEVNSYPVDDEGFLDPYQNKIPDGYGFDLNRDYLKPIPQTQIELNPNLTQNPGWD